MEAAGVWLPGEPAGACTVGPGATLSMLCSWSSPFRPATPVTSPDSEAGMDGADVFTSAGCSPGTWTDCIVVPKADSTAATEPLTGRSALPSSGCPTVRPSARNAEETCATSADEGPNSDANWAGVR